MTLVTSTRQDGNMGLHVGDDPLHVLANRRRFLTQHALDLNNLIMADQIHGDHIEIVTSSQRGYGAMTHTNAIPACDALITTDPSLILGIVTADCVPIILWDSTRPLYAAIHAGWKGTAKTITLKTLQQCRTLGGSLATLYAMIGPSIGACCYKVGEATATACGCEGDASLDLQHLNYRQLIQEGLDPSHITIDKTCTSCHHDRYFSYRADQGQTGRMLTIITSQ